MKRVEGRFAEAYKECARISQDYANSSRYSCQREEIQGEAPRSLGLRPIAGVSKSPPRGKANRMTSPAYYWGKYWGICGGDSTKWRVAVTAMGDSVCHPRSAA